MHQLANEYRKINKSRNKFENSLGVEIDEVKKKGEKKIEIQFTNSKFLDLQKDTGVRNSGSTVGVDSIICYMTLMAFHSRQSDGPIMYRTAIIHDNSR